MTNNLQAAARKNMVECQLRPNGVTRADLLALFESVPRDAFLPCGDATKAYLDEDVLVGKGRIMIEPVILARMLQAAAPCASDIVLNIGDSCGYSTALLSSMTTTVITLESYAGLLEDARKVWTAMDFCNIAVVQGASREGYPKQAPYNLIVINGAVAGVPQNILDQLAPKGRLVTVLQPLGERMGQVALFVKTAAGEISSTSNLYDAATPYVPGFEPVPVFEF
ncbi:MAG: protein-L-isoaspartate O-methyltransferase [Rhodospirillales bacterium]|nr:protein-L-isoaspartate O-methyltransferase [Rhodospirillales bacterium]